MYTAASLAVARPPQFCMGVTSAQMLVMSLCKLCCDVNICFTILLHTWPFAWASL